MARRSGKKRMGTSKNENGFWVRLGMGLGIVRGTIVYGGAGQRRPDTIDLCLITFANYRKFNYIHSRDQYG